eukprot:Platyproteum_vivax@DN5144_c0_g1_i3.p1
MHRHLAHLCSQCSRTKPKNFAWTSKVGFSSQPTAAENVLLLREGQRTIHIIGLMHHRFEGDCSMAQAAEYIEAEGLTENAGAVYVVPPAKKPKAATTYYRGRGGGRGGRGKGRGAARAKGKGKAAPNRGGSWKHGQGLYG